jgi:hypothetical protein
MPSPEHDTLAMLQEAHRRCSLSREAGALRRQRCCFRASSVAGASSGVGAEDRIQAKGAQQCVIARHTGVEPGPAATPAGQPRRVVRGYRDDSDVLSLRGWPMDAMTFVERMFDHLIWPAVILVALLLFRKPIRDRIPQLTQFRVGPLDAVFSHTLEESHDAMANSPDPPPSEETYADRARLLRLAEISPRAAVMEAFALADNALKATLADLGLAPDRDVLRSTQAVILAQSAGLLDSGSAEALNNLRALSNAARHEEHFRVDREKVADYINIATTLREIIEEARAPSHRT